METEISDDRLSSLGGRLDRVVDIASLVAFLEDLGDSIDEIPAENLSSMDLIIALASILESDHAENPSAAVISVGDLADAVLGSVLLE